MFFSRKSSKLRNRWDTFCFIAVRNADTERSRHICEGLNSRSRFENLKDRAWSLLMPVFVRHLRLNFGWWLKVNASRSLDQRLISNTSFLSSVGNTPWKHTIVAMIFQRYGRTISHNGQESRKTRIQSVPPADGCFSDSKFGER